MPTPVHFEIHALDPERAMDFYTAVFDWKFERMDTLPYWLVDTGDEVGINGGLMAREDAGLVGTRAMNAYSTTLGVADLDKAMRVIEEEGGTIVMARQAVIGVGWLAYCEDTEGNPFGIMEADRDAA